MPAPHLQPVTDRSAWRGEDFEEPERKRHLLRIWLAAHRHRPLAPEFEHRFNDGWSYRRGIPSRNLTP